MSRRGSDRRRSRQRAAGALAPVGRRALAVCALICVVLLGGCTGSSGLTSDQARAIYDPVLTDVANAAAIALGTTWTGGTGGGTNLTTEGCRWFTKTLTTELDPTAMPD